MSSVGDSELTALRNRFRRDAELLLQDQHEDGPEKTSQSESTEQRPFSRINRHSVFWLVASVAVTIYTDFFNILLHNDIINRWWLNVGVTLLALCLTLALFCILYLDWFRGVSHYEQEYPALPAVTTAAFIAASCSLNMALWPLWSILTPLVLFTQFMGVVMLVSLLG